MLSPPKHRVKTKKKTWPEIRERIFFSLYLILIISRVHSLITPLFLQSLVQIGNDYYSVILPSSSNGMPALPEPTNAPSSMLISPPVAPPPPPHSVSTLVGGGDQPATVSGNLLPPPSASTSTVNAPAAGTMPIITLPVDQPGPSNAPVPSRRPAQRKNNKRKVGGKKSWLKNFCEHFAEVGGVKLVFIF
jgi:hypothetical protein